MTADFIQAGTDQARLERQLSEIRGNLSTFQQRYDDLQFSMAQAADLGRHHRAGPAAQGSYPEQPAIHRPGYHGRRHHRGGGCFSITKFGRHDQNARGYQPKLGLSTIGTISLLSNGEQGLVVEASPRSRRRRPSARWRPISAMPAWINRSGPCWSPAPTRRKARPWWPPTWRPPWPSPEDRVIAVDADLRLPMLHRLFGLEQDVGLTESLLWKSADGNLQEICPERLSVLTSGTCPLTRRGDRLATHAQSFSAAHPENR